MQLDVAFAGKVTAVDELTGQPLATPIEVEHVGSGLRLKNVRVPYINGRYSQRLTTPVQMPVLRIDGASQLGQRQAKQEFTNLISRIAISNQKRKTDG